MSTEKPQNSEPKQDDEYLTSGSDTESAKTSTPYAGSIRTASLFTVSTASSQYSKSGQEEDDKPFTPNDKQRERENAFLGYYECLNLGKPELSIPTISLSTARINLHIVTARKTEVKEGKHLVLTKIKESPYVKNTSLLIITGKRWRNDGTKFNEFPKWMQGVSHLLDEEPIKGKGTYEVLIKKVNTNNTNEPDKETLSKWEKEADKKTDVTYKMALAGFYMRGNKGNNGDFKKTSKYHLEAKNLYLKASKLGSIEAKLCLGYIYSIGLTKRRRKPPDYKPGKAKKLFKKVAKKTENEQIARISMRNIATLYHSKEINPSFMERITHSLSITDKEPLYLKKAEKWYRKSCDKGDSQSAYHLGLLYESNYGIKEDKNLSETWFKKAVQLDNSNLYAKAKLGRILVNKKDENEKERGFEMLEETARIGLVMSQTYLGEYYEKEKNYEEAIKFYFKAARQRRGYYSHAAQYRLKELKDNGRVDEDTIKDILEEYKNELKYGYIDTKEEFKEIR